MKIFRGTCLLIIASLLIFLTITVSAEPPKPVVRHIELDVAQATKPVDRFFDLSVGSDFPGTLIRTDSQAQLKTSPQ